jgi:hypothetical protein
MKCKVGDLALVIKADVASNQGVLVEVLQQVGRARWWVRSLCGPRLTTDGTRKLEVVALDASLRPIRPAKKVQRKPYVADAGERQASLI